MERLNSNKQRRQERKATKMDLGAQQRVVTLPRRSPSSNPDYFSSNSHGNAMNGSPSSLGINGGVSGSAMYKRKTKREKDPKRKLTTADIGQPLDFR